jgi:hypothetical protein
MTEEPIHFSREVVIAQLAARASLRRGCAAIAAFLVFFWLIAYLIAKELWLPDYLWFVAILLPPVIALIAMRQLQWNVLFSHDLRCPSCRHLLASERRWWNSPGQFCKSCGKLAILPNQALNQAAAT